jgi:hypothetical protein
MINQLKNFTGWKYYIDHITNENVGITITHENGVQESRSLLDIEVAAWINAGNTPEPADQGE